MTALERFKSLFVKTETRSTTTTLNDYLRQGYPNFPFNDNLSVTAESSLQISYVYAAANGISSDISSFKWRVYKQDGKNREEAKDHDQYKLLSKRPYFAYNSVTWIKAWVLNYLLTGDGFSHIIRDNNGRPRAYRLYHKKEIEIFINHETEKLTYRIIATGKDIDSHDMLHLSDLSIDGLYGYSKIGLMKKTLEISMRSDDTQNNLQKNGTYLGGTINLDTIADPEQLEKFRKSFKDVYGGTTGEIAVLDAGAKFTPFDYSMTMADAEFITSRKFTGEEILRYFRYPAHMAQNLDGSATKSNMEQMSLEYVNYCLRPIVVMMENELNGKIFRIREENTHYVKGDLNSLLRGDIASRMALYETMHKVGAMSANDILSKEDMNPIEFGDNTYMDLNTLPTKYMDAWFKSKIANEQL